MPRPRSENGTPARARRGRILRVEIDRSAGDPLYRQIYRSIRREILEGSLSPGACLPSSRRLAGDLGVSRCTVVQAYEQLGAEGYVDGAMGTGTRVTTALPDDFLLVPGRPPAGGAAGAARLSRRATAIVGAWRTTLRTFSRTARAFRVGVPAVDVFPVAVWGRLLSRRWSRTSARMLSYSEPAGFPPLQQAIAEYLRSARGVRCAPEQVFVVSGSQQALDLSARVLCDPGDRVWVEDPGYGGARGAFIAAGAEVVPVPVDDQGLQVACGRLAAPGARAAFVTPSRQLPLGVTMPLARRLELLRWAAEADAWVVEDDYDSEFRYASRPLAALQGLDAHGRVLYTGTFSKVMFPALRLGYLVVPFSLVDTFTAARGFADYHSPYLEQAVLTDFIADGHFERHIRRMRAIYHERQAVLVESAAAVLGGALHVPPADGGLALVGWLPPARHDSNGVGPNDVRVSRAAARAGIDAAPITPMALTHVPRPGLLLGYSGIRESEIREGVRQLAVVLEGMHAIA